MAAAVVFLISIWIVVFSIDAEATRRGAPLEDASRAGAAAVLLCAAVARLVSVGFVLAAAAGRTRFERGVLIALAVATFTAARAAIHTA